MGSSQYEGAHGKRGVYLLNRRGESSHCDMSSGFHFPQLEFAGRGAARVVGLHEHRGIRK